MNRPISQQPEVPPEVRRFPRWIILLGICALLLCTAGIGHHYYLAWEEQQSIQKARNCLKHNNFQALLSTLVEALRMNPNNADIYRIAAQAYLKLGDPRALPWFRRAAQLTPESVDDRLALAEAYLRFDHIEQAEKVLESIKGVAAGRADYHDLAGRVVGSSATSAEAESHFSEAVRLAPQNRSYQLHLAIAQLDSQNSSIREKAQSEIEALLVQPGLELVGLRALVVDALKSNRPERALSTAQRLNDSPDRLFGDCLLYLEVLHALGLQEFVTRLTEIQDETLTAPAQVLPLLTWMNNHHLSLLAKGWVQHLPLDVIAPIPVRLEIARSYAATSSWKELRLFLSDDDWGSLDYMKNALLARCSREFEDGDSISKAAWANAIAGAAKNSDSLIALVQEATQWGWSGEAIDAVWQLALQSDQSSQAIKTLCAYYFANNDTAGLLRIYSLIVDRNPDDSNACNNYAICCLLLNKDKERAASMAREIHDKDPANPVYASTYAFALYCSGKTGLALGVMGALKPEQLREPSVAAYYSVMLNAVGRVNEAQGFRELAQRAKLLPEEERLLKTGTAQEAQSSNLLQ